MNVTFLIGNGFDLRLGLNTRFSDFYDVYIKLNEHNSHPIIREFCDDLRDDCETNGKYRNWADFECAFPKYVKRVENIQSILDDFSLKFCEYLKELETNIVPIDGIMANSFRDFILNSYKKIEFAPDLNAISNLFKSNTNDTYNLINFNYTNTLQLLKDNINSFDTNKTFPFFDNAELHIHGSISESIIIGIDNVNQFRQDELRKNYIGEYCVKSQINKAMGNNNEETFREIIDQSDLIYIYGLSLGISDLSRREVIRDWFMKKGNHYLIAFQHNPQFTKLGKAYFPTYRREFEQLKIDYLLNKFDMDERVVRSRDLYKRLSLVDSDSVLGFKLVKEEQNV